MGEVFPDVRSHYVCMIGGNHRNALLRPLDYEFNIALYICIKTHGTHQYSPTHPGCLWSHWAESGTPAIVSHNPVCRIEIAQQISRITMRSRQAPLPGSILDLVIDNASVDSWNLCGRTTRNACVKSRHYNHLPV